MKQQKTELFYRLTAIWALTESVLGGILHGLKIPVTGLWVGGLAVIYISLLARYSDKKSDILNATMLVLILKGMLAPHTPVAAYFAVFFQGGMGYVLFRFIPNFKMAALSLGIINLLESALQKLIVTTIIFGKDIWIALDEFIAFVLGQFGIIQSDYLLAILSIYLGIYALAGILFGLLAGRAPQSIERIKKQYPEYKFSVDQSPVLELNVRPKKKGFPVKGFIFFLYVLLLILYILPLIHGDWVLLPQNRILQLIIRSVIILGAWFLFVGPFIISIIRVWMAKQQKRFSIELEKTIGLMPETRAIIEKAWQKSGNVNNKAKLLAFISILVVNLFPDPT
jgi:hypothetical protein